MCDLQFRFEEDWTKTAVAIEDDRYFRQTDRQIDRQTNSTVTGLYCKFGQLSQ